MVKKKKTSKKNTRIDSNFNRNLLICIVIFILIFVVVFNFEDMKLKMSPYMMEDEDKGYCKKDPNKPKPCFFQKGESLDHTCCEKDQFCYITTYNKKIDGYCLDAHKTACEKGGILCSNSDEPCCKGTCFEEPGRNGKGICCKEDEYATYNDDGKLICESIQQDPEDFLGTVGGRLRKSDHVPGTGR